MVKVGPIQLGRNDAKVKEKSELKDDDLYGKVVKADEHTQGGSRTGGPVRPV